MSLRILDADLDHPSDFLSKFKELDLSEVQQVKLVEVRDAQSSTCRVVDLVIDAEFGTCFGFPVYR